MRVIIFSVQILLNTVISLAIVSPNQLYDMINSVIDSYMNDSCVVIISREGYTVENFIPILHVNPYDEKIIDNRYNDSLTPKEFYKKFILAPVLELGCTGFLIQVENPALQFQLIEETFVHVNQRTQRMFIFIPITIDSSDEILGTRNEILDYKNFDIRSILRGKSIQYVTDLIFAYPNDTNDQVNLSTHRFSGYDDASSGDEILLDTYIVSERRFKRRANLFPDKIKDLEGKILKVALFHWPPYSVVIDEDNQTTLIDGTEWRFVVEFARLHNGRIKEVIDSEGGMWGNIFENLTGDGLTGNLVTNKADLGITALYSWHHESLYLDLTAPFCRSGITSLVPGPRQIPKWMSPILPFTSSLWITFIGMIFVSVVFTGIVNRAESSIRNEDSLRMSPSKVALTVAGITLLQGLNEDPKRPSWAALSVTLLVFSVLITTAYSSSLSSAMTLPRFEPPINTASELAASGISWVGTHEAWIFSIHAAEEPDMQTLVKNFRVLTEEELLSKASGEISWGFAIERLQGGSYAIQDYLTSETVEKMHLMNSDIYWEYCVSMLRKSSPYTKWYSKRILEIQSTGIPQYWEFVVASRYLDKRAQLAIRNEDTGNDGPVELTLDKVQGIFYILVIGLVASFLVFIGELYASISHNRKTKIIQGMKFGSRN